MSKEKIAEKLGWEYRSYWMDEYYKVGWVSPTSTFPNELPDWENSLDEQARDIWPKMRFKDQAKIISALDNALVANEDIAQACWEAIVEIFNY